MALCGGICQLKRTTMCCKVSNGIVGLCPYCHSMALHWVCSDWKQKAGFPACQLWLHLGSNIQAVSFLALLLIIKSLHLEVSSNWCWCMGWENSAHTPWDVWTKAPTRRKVILWTYQVIRWFNRHQIYGGNRRYFSITSVLMIQLFNKCWKAD